MGIWWIPAGVVLAAATCATLALCWVAVGHLKYALYNRRSGIRPPPLGWAGWIRFYLRTVGGVFRVLWWNLRALGRDGLRHPSSERSGPVVLCVHGFHMNGTCMWGIRRYLERIGRPTQAVYLGLPYRSPDVYARSLRRAMRKLVDGRGEELLDVVAHSMGGLVLRQALADDSALAERVRRVVTLGSPHHGTAFLNVPLGPVYRMMSLESVYVAGLPDFTRTAPRSRVTTIATRHDLVVYPPSVAHLPGARPVNLSGIGHVGLLTEPVALQAVGQALGPPRVDGPGARP